MHHARTLVSSEGMSPAIHILTFAANTEGFRTGPANCSMTCTNSETARRSPLVCVCGSFLCR